MTRRETCSARSRRRVQQRPRAAAAAAAGARLSGVRAATATSTCSVSATLGPLPAGCGRGQVFLARTVAAPAYWQNPFTYQYWTGDGWSPDEAAALADPRRPPARHLGRRLRRRRPRPGHGRADEPGRRLPGLAGQVAGRPVAADPHRPGAVHAGAPSPARRACAVRSSAIRSSAPAASCSSPTTIPGNDHVDVSAYPWSSSSHPEEHRVDDVRITRGRPASGAAAGAADQPRLPAIRAGDPAPGRGLRPRRHDGGHRRLVRAVGAATGPPGQPGRRHRADAAAPGAPPDAPARGRRHRRGRVRPLRRGGDLAAAAGRRHRGASPRCTGGTSTARRSRCRW